MLLFHIFIAILSLISASVTAYRPTNRKFTLTYIATVATLISGVLLTVLESVSVARVCMSGGVYLVAVVALIIVARRKMATVPLYPAP